MTVVEDPAPLLRPLLLVELAVAVEATVEAAAVNVAVVAGGGMGIGPAVSITAGLEG